MGIFTKTLPELVGKVLAREEKVKERIAELEGNIQEISNLIKAKTSQLVQYELAGDTENQKLCRDAIRDHRAEIEEIKGLLEAYRDEMNNISIPEGELSKIKAAALKEQEARKKKMDSIKVQQEQFEKQIEELKKKVKDLSSDYDRIHSDDSAIQEVIKVLRYVDPLTEKLRQHSKEGFAMAWLHDGDTEQYFYLDRIKTRVNTTTEGFYHPGADDIPAPDPDKEVIAYTTHENGYPETKYLTREEIEKRKREGR